MADNVQFILDRISVTLRRLEELKLFSTAEVKSIVKKRTDFEYVMRRRLLTPADFYSYLQYELNLDRLRMLRCDYNNVGKERADALRTVEGACQRHISYIFDRAIRRFPSEMGLWADYVSFLREKKLVSALNALFGRALSLNPKNEDLWLQAAVHELDVNNNLHSARTLLQRSLRANKSSHKLWKKYFELELWNAVRITERQRILGLDVDNSPIQGAPLVVFKHALIALSTDVDFACELHKSSMPVSVTLGESLENMLHESFGGNCKFWSYLAGLSFDRHAIQLDATDNRFVQGRADEQGHKGGEKRKRNRAAAYDIVSYVAKSLDTCSGVLQRAEVAFQEEDPDNSLDQGEGVKYPAMVISAIERALEKASSHIGRISQASFSSFSAVEIEGSVESSSGSKKKSKQEDTHAATATGAAGHSNRAMTHSLSHLLESLNKMSAHMKAARGHLSSMTAGTDCKSSFSMFSALEALAAHRLWLLWSILTPTASASKIDPMDTRNLIAWCALATHSLRGMFQSRNTSIHTSEKAVGEALEVWTEVAEAAMKSSLRAWALSLLTSTEGTNDDALETLRQCGAMIMEASSLICSTSGGNDFIHRSIEVLTSAGLEDMVSVGLKSVVCSPYCAKGTRGIWSAQLVKFTVSLGTARDVDLTHQADSDSRDRGVVMSSPVSPVEVKHQCEAIYSYVEKIFNSQPELLVGAEVRCMYEFVLAFEMKAVSACSAKDRDYAFVSAVASRAIENCPTVLSFWDSCESILRSQGKHQEANHVKWRRDRECQI